MVLKKEPTHGYQIKKLIEERSFGFWTPTDSTMYTILKNLKDKDLIRLSVNQDSNDTRKIYELTKKGLEILDLMLKKEEEMRESMKSIIKLISDDKTPDDDLEDPLNRSMEDFITKGPPRIALMKRSFKQGPFMHWKNNLLENDSLEYLKGIRGFINHFLEQIDERILELESDTKSK
jgi:DNA-binding PadR family transcriptional regulator